MPISKKPEQSDNYKKNHYFFENARSGFYSIMKYLVFITGETLLLPSFIGWSSREGSGIFDPVITSKVNYKFYPLNKDLSIDFTSLEKLLNQEVKAILLVNYFGFPDVNYERICKLLKSRGILIIEDEAHSLYTHFVSGASGYLSDFSIFSLHKMLPYKDGGMVICHHDNNSYKNFYQNNYDAGTHYKCIFQYDFNKISRIRRRNYMILEKSISSMDPDVRMIYHELPERVVPQTCPLLVKSDRRDDLYFGLNAKGFGAISLYHTLINEIDEELFPDAHYLAKNILNLPIHQDASPEQLGELVKEMRRILQ